MIETLLNGILNALTTLVNFILTPINLLFNGLFPSFTSYIVSFNEFCTDVISTGVAYLFSFLPPIFSSLLLTWVSFVIGYYAVHYIYIGYLKIFAIIQKIKFW